MSRRANDDAPPAWSAQDEEHMRGALAEVRPRYPCFSSFVVFCRGTHMTRVHVRGITGEARAGAVGGACRVRRRRVSSVSFSPSTHCLVTASRQVCHRPRRRSCRCGQQLADDDAERAFVDSTVLVLVT